jgi:alkylation response protein AidB-like acyl-CoA dehydrogenase
MHPSINTESKSADNLQTSDSDSDSDSDGGQPAAVEPASGMLNADAVSLILRQAGRSAGEVAALSALDNADRTAENMFSGDPPTLTSLFADAKAREFYAGRFDPSPVVAETMAACVELLMQRKKAGTLLDHDKMLFHDETVSALAEAGFFGLAIPRQYEGCGAQLGDLGPLLRALTFIHADLAVLFEVHNFLGPVTPILDFGTEEQKRYYLPKMARGELLGSFALTEPGAGADPSQLGMTARRAGDRYLISGVKWPITNVIYGGLCVLILKIQGKDLPPGRDSAMILFEVPKTDTAHFRMVRNRLAAFDYLWNARFRLSDYEVPATALLGPPGRGLAQAFSSLAKGRGGICVNSTAKSFKLLAQVILDPSQRDRAADSNANSSGGWTTFRTTFGKRIGESPRIQTWIGEATCHALAGRALGDLCFRLGANGIRDETQGMVAKVYASKSLLQTAIHVYQIQGGRSVHTDEHRAALRSGRSEADVQTASLIENYVGETMHEFTIATVYEGPNPVLADVGAPNAMTRGIRAKYLEPIGLAELDGKFGLGAKARFGWFIVRSIVESLNPWTGSLEGIENLFSDKQRFVRKALRRNRVLGRTILLTIARYQKNFMDQTFLLGDEGGVFDRLCQSLAALVFVLSLDKPHQEYLLIADALDCEADLAMRGRTTSAALQQKWAAIGQLMMQADSTLHQDLVADIEISDIPLDPRFVDRYI